MPELRVMGKRTTKVDALERVTGKAAYGADISLPGMLHAKVLRSPHPHARIRRIDPSRALSLEGVKAVVTAQDLPPLTDAAAAFGGELFIALPHLRQMVLAQDKALYQGQPIAAVAATSLEIAEEALELIRVDYEPLPVVEDIEQAMRPDAPILHPDLRTMTLGEQSKGPTNVGTHIELGRGDVEAGFREADVVIEDTYRIGMAHQGYLEPLAAAAQVDSDGHITVWTSSQGSFNARTMLAALLEVPLNRIKVVPMEVGGAFGGKIYTLVEPLCILLSRKSGRPVKLVLTREEVFKATGPGSAAVITLKVGAKRDGTITAIQGRMLFDAGAFPGSPVGAATQTGVAPYRTPNLKIEGFDVVTNKSRVQAYRAPGATAAAFAFESHMDRVAEALGMDPILFRLKNCPQEKDLQPNEQPFNRIGLRQVLETVSRHPAWTHPVQPHGERDATSQSRRRGRGVGIGYWMGASGVSSARVLINTDGTAVVLTGQVDLTGSRTTLLQIAAEELVLSPEEMTITVGDTDTAPYTGVSGGSRTTYSMGTAVHRACQDAIRQMKTRAAEVLRISPEDVEYTEKRFFVRHDREKAVSWLEIARQSIRHGEGPIIGKGAVTRLQQAPAFALHMADVEVDLETGKVNILRYTCVQDVGLAVNPIQVEGQMQGGASQGIGWGLWEGYVYEKGILKNASFLDYHMPTALDLPMIETVIVEVPASDGPYGVRGVGEVPIVPPPGALANAIYKATGVRVKNAPMTTETVFWALQRGKGEHHA